MTYGDPITSPIPAVNSSGTQYATDINALLKEIVTRLESTVPFSALAGGTLDLDGQNITDVGYVSFSNGTGTPASAPAGRIVYSNGEFWLINSTGAIQITSGVAINSASIGGITGDYGGENPAQLRFTDASHTYSFYDDYAGGAWAYNKVRGIDVTAGATSAFYNRITFAGSANNNVILFDDKPASGRSVVVYDAAGKLFHNDATNTVENDIKLSATARVREIGRKVVYTPNFYSDVLIGTGSAWSAYTVSSMPSGVIIGTKGTGGGVALNLQGLEAGITITSVNVRINKTATGSAFFDIIRIKDGATSTAISSGSITSTGWKDITVSGSYTTLSGYHYVLRIFAGDNNDTITNVEITYNT